MVFWTLPKTKTTGSAPGLVQVLPFGVNTTLNTIEKLVQLTPSPKTLKSSEKLISLKLLHQTMHFCKHCFLSRVVLSFYGVGAKIKGY